MPKALLKYNPETLCFEPHQHGWRRRLLRFAVQISTFLVVSFLSALIINHISGGLKYKNLANNNLELTDNIQATHDRLVIKDQQISRIQTNETAIYRTILQLEPVSELAFTGGTGGSRASMSLWHFNNDILERTYTLCEKVEHKLQIELHSLTKMANLAAKRSIWLRSRPYLQPVQVKDLWCITDLYGGRHDPFTGAWRSHSGMDFAGAAGAEIVATGDGIVSFSGWDGGYGNMVEINHGFGYTTRYGHLKNYSVKPGQRVKRGEVVGQLGSTGRSTGPHLHYEVRLNNRTVDPRQYYTNDLTQNEFETIMANSKPENN